MSRCAERTPSRLPLAPRALLLAAFVAACACAIPGSNRPAQTEVRDENGFTILEDVRVGAEVRADFASATSLLEQKRYDEAIALLVKVTQAAPQVTAAHIDLGIAYGQINALDLAETSIKRALELNPRHPVALNELGILYRKTGRFEQARKSYERALSRHPEFHYARRNLAILCDVFLADLECALENYALYAKAVPDDEAAAVWMADLQSRMAR